MKPKISRKEYLERMVPAYVECALWAETDEDGTPFDGQYGPEHLTRAALAEMRRDCRAFLSLAWDLLGDWEPAQAGHDFWLTRNGHGAGFWDRGKDSGNALSDIAHTFGECSLYAARKRLHIA